MKVSAIKKMLAILGTAKARNSEVCFHNNECELAFMNARLVFPCQHYGSNIRVHGGDLLKFLEGVPAAHVLDFGNGYIRSADNTLETVDKFATIARVPDFGRGFTLEAAQLAGLYGGMDIKEYRDFARGILVSPTKGAVLATDGKMLVKHYVSPDVYPDFAISEAMVKAMLRCKIAKNWRIWEEEGRVYAFSDGGIRAEFPVHACVFPNWERVIPTTLTEHVEIARADVLAALPVSAKQESVHLTFDEVGINVGDFQLLSKGGAKWEADFSVKLLCRGVNAVTEDTITIHYPLETGYLPIKITGGKALALVMSYHTKY